MKTHKNKFIWYSNGSRFTHSFEIEPEAPLDFGLFVQVPSLKTRILDHNTTKIEKMKVFVRGIFNDPEIKSLLSFVMTKTILKKIPENVTFKDI